MLVYALVLLAIFNRVRMVEWSCALPQTQWMRAGDVSRYMLILYEDTH